MEFIFLTVEIAASTLYLLYFINLPEFILFDRFIGVDCKLPSHDYKIVSKFGTITH